jgi:hypothetical protein
MGQEVRWGWLKVLVWVQIKVWVQAPHLVLLQLCWLVSRFQVRGQLWVQLKVWLQAPALGQHPVVGQVWVLELGKVWVMELVLEWDQEVLV